VDRLEQLAEAERVADELTAQGKEAWCVENP
jgi:hypothetical protein